ncbi:MAG TPA: DNA polymerase/3'-5' exonuclease PolX [Methylomirabilota bacterium]|nr:DNA polymerase/3'-5' exonuclease PolX [Methylomirabilota bacterium]
MKNFEIARQFDLMADLLEIKGENPFRIRAYRRAAQNLESLTEDVEALVAEDRLDGVPGIGKDLAAKIAEYLETGQMGAIEEEKKGIPAGVVELMNVPGVGPKTAKLLYEKAGVHDVGKLEELAKAGRLKGLPGIQAKTEANILRGIAVVRQGQARMLLGRALPLAEELAHALERVKEVKQLSLAGSIRRRKETVGDIDILATSAKPEKIMDAFVRLPQVADVLERGGTKASIRHREGIQVDLRVVEPETFGAALVYFTGSKQHNIRIREMAQKKGLKISEYGVFRESTGRRVAGKTEEEVYSAVGLPWIPPELREDAGEIEAALKRRLPELVELDDIRGDLHDHTHASDGHHSIEALVEKARERGYEYIVVSDHSRSATIARGLSVEALRAHVKKIRAVQEKFRGITILAGSECDILADGSMDYPDEVLAGLDLVLAAVHARFKQPRAEMTRRICRALENPYVSILAHPTGRLIGERDAYDVDLDAVFRTAKRHGKAVEINCYPQRLDLNDVHARRAAELGVLIAINTDTHFLDHLENVQLGVATARRAWIGPAQVINAWPLKKLLPWAHHGRPRDARAGKKRG